MNDLNSKVERRRYPRIKREIPLKIKLDDYDLVGQTNNISSVGTYCTVDKYIPVFSIISIILLLPIKDTPEGVCSIRCKGAVVRSQENPEDKNKYNVAIYFNRLRKSDKTKLLQYVQHYL